MSFENADTMDRFMDWVVANQTTFPIVRAKAWPHVRAANEDDPAERWRARIVLKTEDDVRRLYALWRPECLPDLRIRAWR